MTRLQSALATLFLLPALSGAAGPSIAQPDSPTLALINGHWFDGESFEPREMFCQGGVFTDQQPAQVDQVIDLAGDHVIPPFTDAHTHHFDNPGIFDAVNNLYLEQGVFYAISLTNWVTGKQALADRVAAPETVDVAYADAGLTASYGHPITVYESLARGDYAFDRSRVDYADNPKALNKAYRLVDQSEDIDAAWLATLESEPDLVKIYLMHSEAYAERKQRQSTYGDRGLDPDLVPQLVARAHGSNLRVAAHVESAADFAVAVSAGVDIVGHLPGYGPEVGEDLENYRISADTARMAAQQGTVVIPTPVANTEQRYGDKNADFAAAVRQLQKANIETLHRAGVQMAIGADGYFQTPLAEVKQLEDFNIFTNRELLNMWTRTSAQLAFPTRKLGELKPGYEGSFISLKANPLEDFSAIQAIGTRVKSCVQVKSL